MNTVTAFRRFLTLSKIKFWLYHIEEANGCDVKFNFTLHFSGMEWYAYVIFYSVSGAKNALKQSGKIKVGETEIQIRKKHHYRPHTKRELPLYKAQELLTFYFGFNCWSSEVVYVSMDFLGRSSVSLSMSYLFFHLSIYLSITGHLT